MTDYGFGELAAAVLARRLRDGELGIVTTTSPVAVAACGLAQRRGRWVSWLGLPLATLDARSEHLRASADERLIPTATAALDLAAILDAIAWRPHFFDFGFLDALQVDRYGNVNTVATFFGSLFEQSRYVCQNTSLSRLAPGLSHSCGPTS